MIRPTILALDDDRVVLNAVERDLRQKYGRDYRIIKSDSGKNALEILAQLQQRNDIVALFLVDQRMPEMNGVQFLEQAKKLFPEARKVLLTAYADTEVAINAINKIGLDYYLMKPWDPPQDNLYPVIDSLLEDWKANTRLPFEGIRMVGAQWSSETHTVKDFLSRNQIPYQYLDIDSDVNARVLADAAGKEELRLPKLFFTDGSMIVQPSTQMVAEKVGLRTRAEKKVYDVVVIGGGPAGLSAAVYASADGLKVLLIERQAPGGQAGNSPKIENYLGFPSGISGGDLTRRAVTQAKRFGAEIVTTQVVTKIRSEGNLRVVTLSDGSEVSGKLVLIATGAWFNILPLESAKRFNGAGIFYGAAHTEGAYYANKEVVVVGAANSAAQGMLFLANLAKKVYVVHRRNEPSWSNYLDVAIRQNDKIELLFNHEVIDVHGNETLEGVTLKNKVTGEIKELNTSAMFVFIGQKPQSDFVADTLLCSPSGHILTGLDLIRDGKRPKGWMLDRDPLTLETSIPGVFAAGDVRNGTKHGVCAATGDGNVAVAMFWQYFSMT
jgi:thioredoxin reductase (NADPH)